MMSQILVATLISADAHFCFVVLCPHCKQKNMFNVDLEDKSPTIDEIDLAGIMLANCMTQDVSIDSVDSIECWHCNQVSFLDKHCKNSSDDEEPLHSIKGEPVN